MTEGDGLYRKSGSYRIWVDEEVVGHIRILKRINFKTLVAIFEELNAEIKKTNPGRAHIKFYISRSLYAETSVNAKEFLDFCQSCMGVIFELVLLD